MSSIQLTDILAPKRCVYVPERYDTSQLFEAIAALLTPNHLKVDTSSIIAAFLAREKLASTAIGSGIALPHIRLPTITTTIGAFVRLYYSIDFASPDNKPVDLFFALLVPEKNTNAHLNTLSYLAEMFSHSDFCARLRQTENSADLYQLLQEKLKTPAIPALASKR
ncbi:PTS IIA-like nitrogen regulatory protein PtsN [soil metagenome]